VAVEGRTDVVREVIRMEGTSKPALVITVNAAWDCHPRSSVRFDAPWGPYAILYG
jgi:hypothetical protein